MFLNSSVHFRFFRLITAWVMGGLIQAIITTYFLNQANHLFSDVSLMFLLCVAIQ